MKRTLILLSFLLVFSCKKLTKTDVNLKEITSTQTLQVSDTLIPFSGHTDSGKSISISDTKKTLFLFFKKGDKSTLLFNEEIDFRNFKNENVDVLILNDPKIAKLYGLELTPSFKLKTNYLFISDENRIIKNIYESICQKEVFNLLQKNYDLQKGN